MNNIDRMITGSAFGPGAEVLVVVFPLDVCVFKLERFVHTGKRQ